MEPFREDVAEFYRKIDLLLLPSLWEGLPLVLLEALSAGIPGAVTPVGVIPDYFRDGVGYLEAADAEKDAPTLFDLLEEGTERDAG